MNDVVVQETLMEAVDGIDFSTNTIVTRQAFARAVALKVAAGWPDARCAREVGLKPVTFSRFLQECEEAREVWDEARDRNLQRFRDAGRSTILEMVENPDVDDKVRERAAEFVLERTDLAFMHENRLEKTTGGANAGTVAPLQVNVMIVNQGTGGGVSSAIPATVTVVPALEGPRG